MEVKSPIRIEMSKFPGHRHYHFDGFFLGADEAGLWVAVPQGTYFDRPGHQFETGFPQVILVPDGRPWIAHYFGLSAAGAPPRHAIYVDMTTLPFWNSDRTVLEATDLDLDVVLQNDGYLRIDDIDEFFVNKAEKSYPPEVAAMAAETCVEIYGALRQRSGAFDERFQEWLAQIGATSPLAL